MRPDCAGAELYEAFRDRLYREMGVKPEPATVALRDASAPARR